MRMDRSSASFVRLAAFDAIQVAANSTSLQVTDLLLAATKAKGYRSSGSSARSPMCLA